MLKDTVMPVDKFGDCTGESGPAGPMGPIGPQGKRGVDGAVGARGPKGDTGSKGEDGTMGQTGPQGKRGADGARGPKGLKGEDGSKGDDGPAGQDAFNLIQWAPHAIRRLFRESEAVNIYFNNATDGIIFKNKMPIGLKNRGLEGDAKFIGQNFPNFCELCIIDI